MHFILLWKKKKGGCDAHLAGEKIVRFRLFYLLPGNLTCILIFIWFGPVKNREQVWVFEEYFQALAEYQRGETKGQVPSAVTNFSEQSFRSSFLWGGELAEQMRHCFQVPAQ